MPTERLLTIDEAAELCGVQVATLRYWRVNNKGPVSSKRAGVLIYRRTEVERWLDEQYAQTARGDGV